MRDDILIQAIDNTEDVLLHGGKWTEEAKERVRQARRAGRRVSEMFTNLYNSTGRYVNQAGKNVKRMANLVDSKYNITENNARTRVLYKKELRNARNVPHTKIETMVNPKAGKRRDNSVEARLRQALKKQSKTKYANKQFKDNVREWNKATIKYVNAQEPQKKINEKRERVQRRRIYGK
ncbi:hypothetical protein [Aureimonas psammosilenae]|uniref:hypothetical protein n=1 Tax=Aureimonas psammosilenae TaxID=2495496 RepID=UPI0012604094|nr:hypothetical protein [Aureimonas psammosilenae]